MSDLVGPIFISDSPGGDFQKKIDSEVMRLLKEAYARVRKLLSKVSVSERGQLLLVWDGSTLRGAWRICKRKATFASTLQCLSKCQMQVLEPSILLSCSE
jgi:hypothetical protein